MIEHIYDVPAIDGSEGLLAIIIRSTQQPYGTIFLTDPAGPLQVATIRHEAGHVIAPHIHLPAPRRVTMTQEVLFVRSGVVKVKLYTSARDFIGERTLTAGDVVVLLAGGHGFEFSSDAELIEVKTGPYQGAYDKVRFGGVDGAISAT